MRPGYKGLLGSWLSLGGAIQVSRCLGLLGSSFNLAPMLFRAIFFTCPATSCAIGLGLSVLELLCDTRKPQSDIKARNIKAPMLPAKVAQIECMPGKVLTLSAPEKALCLDAGSQVLE